METSLRKLFLFLSLFVLILIGMHFFPADPSSTIADKFNLDGEANIPAWYSTVLLFSISISSIVIYLSKRNGIGRDNSWHKFWLGFGGIFCFLSLDEAARFHESVTSVTSTKWIFFYTPFAGIFFIVCAIYFVAVRNSDINLRLWVMGGLVVYIFGGLVIEIIGSIFHPLSPVLQQAEFVFEEGFEMMGAIMILTGCLHELRRLYRIVNSHEDVNT